jgi:hypothetical protein
MDVYYEIKEYLTIKNRLMGEDFTAKDAVIAVMDYQLSALGALLLRQQANVISLALTADNVRYSFSGSKVTSELDALMNALRESRNVELTMHYGFYAQGLSSGPVAGPRNMLCLMEALNAEELDGIFYCTWFEPACDSDTGAFYAYGEWDGICHHGETDASAVSLSAFR